MEQILFLKICRNGKDSTADHNVSFKVLIHSQTSAQRPRRGHKKMAVVERFKQESMYDLSAKKSGCCREVAVIRGSTVTKLKLNHNQVSLKLYTNAMGIIKQTPMSMFSAYLLVYLSLTKVFGAMHVTVKANVKICNK